jgi:hypothetical protein
MGRGDGESESEHIRDARRRLLPYDGLGHLFDRPHWPQDHRRRLRQRRLRRHQSPSERKGRDLLQQSDSRLPVRVPFAVDFAAHAASMGALTRKVDDLAGLEDAIAWAKTTDRTTVLCIATDPFEWTAGDAWWDVGVPQISPRPEVLAAHAEQLIGRERQRHGV